ncbi:unnamed protein product, partial [Closterium sp. NIES-54]
AEIYAGAMAAQELRWLTYLLIDLGEQPRSPPVLYVDNKAMLALCREHRLEHRTKHIALRYFLARELQQRGQLRLAYVASQANTADIFTKALPPGDHQRFCTMLGFPTSTVLVFLSTLCLLNLVSSLSSLPSHFRFSPSALCARYLWISPLAFLHILKPDYHFVLLCDYLLVAASLISSPSVPGIWSIYMHPWPGHAAHSSMSVFVLLPHIHSLLLLSNPSAAVAASPLLPSAVAASPLLQWVRPISHGSDDCSGHAAARSAGRDRPWRCRHSRQHHATRQGFWAYLRRRGLIIIFLLMYSPTIKFLQAIKTASGETAPTLQSLNNIVDTMLAHVSAMTHLRYIDLDYASGFRAEGIKHLYRLPQLKMLFFTDTDVSDSALEGIGALTSLKLLELARTKVTDADLPHRIGLCSLEQLSLSGCMGVMNVGLVHVGRLTRLQELRLFGTAVTDDGLQQLTALTKLKSLWTQADYVRSGVMLRTNDDTRRRIGG